MRLTLSYTATIKNTHYGKFKYNDTSESLWDNFYNHSVMGTGIHK